MTSPSASDIWKAALADLQFRVTPSNYQTWLSNTIGLSYLEDSFVVGVPNALVGGALEKRLQPLIQKTLVGITGQNSVEVLFRVCNDKPEKRGEPQQAAPLTGYQFQPPKLNSRYTFSRFIVGNSNRLAHAAAMAVAERPGQSFNNPLFVYSGVGLGKTHLLHAIGHVVMLNTPLILYVTAEQFTNDFITAIRTGKTEEFRHKYRSVDLLLIDDIQFLAGKDQMQEGLFHTFNDLHNAGSQIVISSDRPPKSLSRLEDRLRSRFEWGLSISIEPPDLETRLAILQAKAEEHRVEVSSEVLYLIARRVHKNVRELEGALNRVIAFARLNKSIPNPELAAQALTEITTEASRRTVTAETIISSVADYYRLDLEVLKGKRRNKAVSSARQVAMYLLREEIGCPWTEIGRQLGGRDHSTALHGYQKISAEINSIPELRSDMIEIRERLHSPSG
ncbi:chromosomal replication initiator protein DnaA [Chloroflexota bacterium]